MNNWKTVRLGDYVNIKTGKLDANASSPNGQYPFFTCSIEPLRIDSYSYDCECVLVAGNGDLNVKYYNGKFEAYQRTYIIESKDKNSLSVVYLYSFLNFYIEILRKESIGGVIKYIKLGNLTEAKIPLPPLAEQKHIAAVLDKCTSVIAKHREMLAKYDTLIKSRFIEMFGDEPIENGKWKVERLENVCTKITDGEHGSVSRTSNGFVFLNAKHIKQSGEIDWGTATYISEENHKKIYKRCNPQHNDILLTTTGTIGNVAIVPDVKEFSMDRGITLLKPQFSILNPQFIASYLRMDKMQVIMNQNVHASAIGHLFLNKVYSLQIPVPPLSLQNDFASFVQQIDKSKFAVQKSLDKAETLYKALMQEYFGA